MNVSEAVGQTMRRLREVLANEEKKRKAEERSKRWRHRKCVQDVKHALYLKGGRSRLARIIGHLEWYVSVQQ